MSKDRTESATEAKWRMSMAALEQRIHDFIRTNPRDLDDWREEMDVLRTLVKAYRETSSVSPAAAPDPYPDNEADGVVFCGKCGGQR